MWEHDPGRETLTLIYVSRNSNELENSDNVTSVPQTRDIFLCEDSPGDQFIRGVTQDGEIYNFAQAITNDTSSAVPASTPTARRSTSIRTSHQLRLQRLLPDLVREFAGRRTEEEIRHAADAALAEFQGRARPLLPHDDRQPPGARGSLRRPRAGGRALGVDRSLALWRRALSEGLATFFLVLAGCGAIVADERFGGLGPVGVAMTFGLVVAAMVSATGHLSGAHLNPAVTVAFALTRHFPARSTGAYVAAQVLGATAGALVLLAAWPAAPADLGATRPSVGPGAALLYEGLLSAVLMFVIVAVATDVRAVGSAAALTIGGTVALDALFGGPATGASMNPARSLGPALAAGEWRDLWIYFVGPLAGAALGAFAYQVVRGEVPRPVTAPDPEGSRTDGQGPVRLPA